MFKLKTVDLAARRRVGGPFFTALIVFLVLRLGTSFAVAIDHRLAPDATWGPVWPCSPETAQALQELGPASQYLLAPWERWDTCHYVFIAEHGYAGNELQTVWPPLYPALIWLVDRVVSPTLLAAIIVANLATLATLWLFFKLVAADWGEGSARRAVILMAAYPTAFFLVAGYTEALFMALVLATMLALKQRRWVAAGVFGFLATLTRNQGFLLAIPIFWEGWRELRKQGRLRLPQVTEIGAAQALPALAFAGFALYVHFTLKDPWPWQTLAKYWTLNTTWPWEGLLGNLRVVFGAPIPDGFNLRALIADLGLTLLAGICLILGAKRLPVSYSLYAWTTLLIGLVKVHETGVMMSMSRYTLSLFPIFIVQALEIRERLPFWLWVALNAAGQVVLLIAFTRWIWVA